MLGYEPKEGPGDRAECVERLHPDDRALFFRKLNEVLSGDFDNYRYEARVRHADGSYRWHYVKGFGIERDSGGNPIRMLGIRMDITERKRAEEMLHRLNEELDQRVRERTAELEKANVRLQELDRLKTMFIASMSHELRTPLNSAIGFTRILHEGWTGPLNEEQKTNLATILKSCNHLLALVNDVIDVSRIEAEMIEAEPEEFDIGDLLVEVAISCEGAVREKGVELEVRPVRHTMHTDRTRLLQCLLNLATNAVKYTEQGTIAIGARVLDGGEMLELTVADTGIGIREEDLEKLFHPFVRLDSHLAPTVPGTGLGLYLTRKLASGILRGRISAKSAYGTGSVFVLTVPVSLR
ncbi:MAG TPA: ATP-binding protein, partial [Bacteroidota bacterium]